MSETTTAKRLAKNTAFMYARMGLLMLISLYTSRVVLQQLGIDDYGTYGLVGSIVTMFSSLRGIFATSTQRFINYEMGKGNKERLVTIFNMSNVINLIISLLFIILVEAVGYWFLNYKMVIDPSRLFAAKLVFQFSIFSAVVSLLTTPFDALIIAHERMDVYAYFAILEGVLRLGVVFLLGAFGFDKLIFYGFLQLLVSVIIRFLNAFFCRKKFEECRYARVWDKSLFKEMATFAGWNFLGNTAFSLVQSGLDMILNTFCGLAANAARGLAYQVNAAINRVLKSVSTVVNPFCTKTYAGGQQKKLFDMMYLSTKIYFSILACLVIPLAFMARPILQLWLGQVPEYAVGFMQLVLLFSLIRTPHEPIDNLFKSVGDIKIYQIVEIIIQTSTLAFSYLILRAGITPYWTFGIMNIMEICNYFAIIIVAHKVTPIVVGDYLKKAILPCVIGLFISFIGYYFNSYFQDRFFVQLVITVGTVGLVMLYMYFIGMSKFEQQQLLSIVKKNK